MQQSSFVLSIIILIVITVFMAVVMWRLFEKAGRAGWKSLIPIYNAVVLCKIGNVSPWVLLLLPLSIVPIIGWIIPLGVTYYIYNGVCEEFNKGTGFAIGTTLFPFIFFPILAFGKSEYQSEEEF